VPDYLTLVEVLTIHDVLVAEFGGATGVRDPGALESALFRPQTGYYRDVIEEAAALFESLVQNHPFVDGNKRAGFAATDVFLRMNGYVLDVDQDASYSFIVGSLERGEFRLELIDAWLRQHLGPDAPSM
jgi:death-on-curing protein